MNEFDVKQAVEDAGSAIAPSFHRDLRAIIEAELSGEVAISSRPAHRASPVRTRLWIGLAAVGIAAAAAVVAVVVDLDDQSTVLVPATAVSHETQPDDTASSGRLVEQLSTSRWVLNESSGSPVFFSAQAFLDFVPTSSGFVAQFDGCDQYSVVDHGEHALTIEAQVFNCPAGTATWGVATQGGDELVVSDDGSHLDLVSPDDATPRFGYVRMDSLGQPVDENGLVGRWLVGDTDPATIDIAADGTLTIVGCRLHWRLTDRLSVTGDGGAPATCAAVEQDEASRWLIDMFGRGPVETRIDPTTDRLHLSSDLSIMQLVSATTDVADSAVLFARLGEHQWMLDSVGGRAFGGALVPWVSFESSLVGGYDGCNEYQIKGSLDGDTIRTTGGESTADPCRDVQGGVRPMDGDRIVMSADDLSFDLVDAGGTARLGFTRFDRLGAPPNTQSLSGRWQLGDKEGTVVEFSEDGTVSFAGCTWAYEVDGQLNTTLASGSGPSCLAADADRTSAALIGVFDRGSSLALLADDGTRMYVLYDVAIQLVAIPSAV